MSADSEKIVRPEAVQSGWQRVKCILFEHNPARLKRPRSPLLIRMTIKLKTELSLMNNSPTPKQEAHEALIQPFYILLRARCNEKEMKVKPATSFKIIYSFCW